MFGQQQSWQQEKRTDIYHPHSPAVGIKERGVAYSEIDRAWANDVEVKFRKEVDEAGFEKWKKKRVRGEEELNRELCENGHVGLQAVSSMSRCSTVVKLEKSRRKSMRKKCATTTKKVCQQFFQRENLFKMFVQNVCTKCLHNIPRISYGLLQGPRSENLTSSMLRLPLSND